MSSIGSPSASVAEPASRDNRIDVKIEERCVRASRLDKKEKRRNTRDQSTIPTVSRTRTPQTKSLRTWHYRDIEESIQYSFIVKALVEKLLQPQSTPMAQTLRLVPISYSLRFRAAKSRNERHEVECLSLVTETSR